MPSFYEEDLAHKKIKYAYDCVSQFIGSHPDLIKKYRSEVVKTPEKLFRSGLMQTLTLYLSKGASDKDKHCTWLSYHMLEWAIPDNPHYIDIDYDATRESVRQGYTTLLNITSPDLMIQYTERARSIADYLKKAAEMIIPDEGD
jgi:CRISPR type III-B/RAMP module-associated protein Cmr5